jgi:hypothetical protein
VFSRRLLAQEESFHLVDNRPPQRKQFGPRRFQPRQFPNRNQGGRDTGRDQGGGAERERLRRERQQSKKQQQWNYFQGNRGFGDRGVRASAGAARAAQPPDALARRFRWRRRWTSGRSGQCWSRSSSARCPSCRWTWARRRS